MMKSHVGDTTTHTCWTTVKTKITVNVGKISRKRSAGPWKHSSECATLQRRADDSFPGFILMAEEGFKSVYLCCYTNTHNPLHLQLLHRDLMVQPLDDYLITFKPSFHSLHPCSAHHITQWCHSWLVSVLKYFYSHGTLSYFNEVFHSGCRGGQKSHDLVLALFGVVVLPPRLTAATVQRHRPFPQRARWAALSQMWSLLIGCTQRHLCSDWCLPGTSWWTSASVSAAESDKR